MIGTLRDVASAVVIGCLLGLMFGLVMTHFLHALAVVSAVIGG
jgi:uncharacterized membrane protein YgaE (UPF0421/DUF939 family)